MHQQGTTKSENVPTTTYIQKVLFSPIC